MRGADDLSKVDPDVRPKGPCYGSTKRAFRFRLEIFGGFGLPNSAAIRHHSGPSDISFHYFQLRVE